PAFQNELKSLATHYAGRPSPLYHAKRFTRHLDGAKVYFKREELNHTGSHKINNVLGQVLLAKRMGKTRVIAETGAGQHGVAAAGPLPDTLSACIGGGSNAMGLFHPFLDEPGIRMIGVEAAGHGLETGQHAASLTGGRPGVPHGNLTYLLQDKEGQITEAHSISAGLDYPGIGPEHSWLKEMGRVEYVSATDDEAVAAFQLLCRLEGIIPALESAHALAHVMRLAPT